MTLLKLCPECGSDKLEDSGPICGKPPGQAFHCPECGYEGTSFTEGDEVTARALREAEEEMENWSRARYRRMCSQCGSGDLLDAFWRGTGWEYRCRNCNYAGAVVEGDEETARALREQHEARERSRPKSAS
ncbi:MAG: hypothetical protein QXT68_08415 [Halobacteria archaeon]